MGTVTQRLIGQLKRAPGVSTSHLARRLGVPRSWLYKVDGGLDAKVETMARAGKSQGLELNYTTRALTLSLPKRDVPAAITELQTSSKNARNEVQHWMPSLIEAEARAEHIHLDYSKIWALSEGTMTSGDPLDVQRVVEVSRHYREALSSRYVRPQCLRALGVGGVVEENLNLASPHRELDFLTRSLQVGADPVLTRTAVNGALVAQGYPWLSPSFDKVEEYRRGLYLVKYLDPGRKLLEVLAESAQERRIGNVGDWWWEEDAR